MVGILEKVMSYDFKLMIVMLQKVCETADRVG